MVVQHLFYQIFRRIRQFQETKWEKVPTFRRKNETVCKKMLHIGIFPSIGLLQAGLGSIAYHSHRACPLSFSSRSAWH